MLVMLVYEKEKYICMNHDPSWVFRTKNPDPICPKCKTSAYISCYSGDREPIRKGSGESDKKQKEQKQMSIMS
jgi:hypothetical protein